MLILRNRDGTRIKEPTADNIYSDADHIAILRWLTTAQTADVTVLKIMILLESAILIFSAARPLFTALQSDELQSIAAQTSENKQRTAEQPDTTYRHPTMAQPQQASMTALMDFHKNQDQILGKVNGIDYDVDIQQIKIMLVQKQLAVTLNVTQTIRATGFLPEPEAYKLQHRLFEYLYGSCSQKSNFKPPEMQKVFGMENLINISSSQQSCEREKEDTEINCSQSLERSQ
ncbi:MAG: hypothetical protein EZS28_029593, partial [Streblomastix strix]